MVGTLTPNRSNGVLTLSEEYSGRDHQHITFSIGTAPTPAPQHNLQKKKWNARKLDLEALRDFLTRNSSSFQNNPTPNIRHETEATVSKTMGLITALPHVMLLCHDGKGEALIVWHIGGHKR
ncbi:hypothetical protein J6590_076902 [Homalodisca vitripennis]|nr:hypothetical protein J6590_076902 [Homalodisca vitripennis]